MKRWNCPVSQWAFPFTFTPRLTECQSFPSKTNIGITGNAKRRQRRKKGAEERGFLRGLCDAPVIPAGIQSFLRNPEESVK